MSGRCFWQYFSLVGLKREWLIRVRVHNRVKVETMVKRKPEKLITAEQVKVKQAKEWLSLKEAAMVLNVSPLTLSRWVLTGKVKSEKVGRKHLFKMENLRKIA